MKINTRNLIILAILMLLAIACVPSPAMAGEKPMPYNEALVSDFIVSHAACTKGKQALCERTMQLCPIVKPKAAELNAFIWSEFPYKAKNGGMNIRYRFNQALKYCA